MTGAAIRVLVADDEPTLREALADLIRSHQGFELVGAVADAEQAIELAMETRPDVALVDARMPGGGGQRVAAVLRDAAPRIAVLVLSAFGDRGNVFEMLRAGAIGYLVKGSTTDEILSAIEAAAAGRGVLSPPVAGHVVAELVGGVRPLAPEPDAAIRVLAVDDDPAILAALTALIAEDRSLELVGVATDRYEAVTLAATHRPHVALVDARMPDGGGAMAAAEILRSSPDTNVLALSAHREPEVVLEMLTAGASGYLIKGSSAILREIHIAARGESTLASEVTGAVVGELVLRLERERQESDARRDETDAIRGVLTGGPGLRMVLQPIVELDGLRLFAAEALARFELEPRRTPDVWFRRAATLGLGPELELCAVRAALSRLPDLPSDSLLTVNVSPPTILSSALAEVLEQAAPRIVLEVTEHAAVEHYEPLNAALRSLRGMGVKLAVDDAGAGFASLQHILQLEPDYIKLDISLCRSIDTDPRRRALAETLRTFADDIGAQIIAEGIETQRELDTLHSFGIRYGQGYFLGKPQPLPLQPY